MRSRTDRWGPECGRAPVRKLESSGKTLVFVYEAGPCGFGIHRWLKARGHECWVVAPSMTPKKPGERIKTDTRDA